MGKFSRDKGKRGERSTATELRKCFPELEESIRRGWQAREGDDEADVIGVPGYWFEVKTGKVIQVLKALEQASSASNNKRSTVPVAVLRPDRKTPFVALYWTDFLMIIRRIFDYEYGQTRKDR